MSTAAVALQPPPLPAAASPVELRDFSDRLSPMLVKELRQGLRSPLFVWALIAMNALLTLMVLFMTAGDGGQALTALFWLTIAGVLCLLLPVRAGGALNSELRGGTIDCLVLTRLTGWRITLGKWIAVAAQQALIAVTVLPYLVVRYFTGGVNLPGELLCLGLLFFVGAVASAVLTGFSWMRHFLARTLCMLGLLAVCAPFCFSLVFMIVNPFSGGAGGIFGTLTTGEWKSWLLLGTGFLLPAAHLSFFALGTGAQKTGTAVENHSAPRRLAGLGVLAIYILMAFAGSGGLPGGGFLMGIGTFRVLILLTVFVLIIQALGETPVNLPPVLRPFARRGVFGSWLGRWLLYPGWPSGVRFSLLLIAGSLLVAGVISNGTFRSDFEDLTSTIGAFGMLAVPLVLYQAFLRRRVRWSTPWYLLLLLLSGPVHLIFSLLSLVLGTPAVFLPALILPSTAVWMDMGSQDSMDDSLQFLFTVVTSAAWWLAAFVLSHRALKETRRAERDLQAADAAAPAIAENT